MTKEEIAAFEREHADIFNELMRQSKRELARAVIILAAKQDLLVEVEEPEPKP